MMIKIAKHAAPVLIILTLLVTAQIARADEGQQPQPVQKQCGIVKGVDATGNGPDANNRYEYEVTIKIGDQNFYLKMWMTQAEAKELRLAIGKKITIFYRWANGKRIYIGFSFGDHTNDFGLEPDSASGGPVE